MGTADEERRKMAKRPEAFPSMKKPLEVLEAEEASRASPPGADRRRARRIERRAKRKWKARLLNDIHYPPSHHLALLSFFESCSYP